MFDRFFLLGIEHILTGYDHLLFLLGLLVTATRWRSIVAIITCFTVGHSLTLALVTLGVIGAVPQLVEPLIAATIAFVGIENLVRREAPPHRGWLTLVFGLVHGCGFAGVLRGLGIGVDAAGEAVVPLLAFNLGVETGQLAVAAVVLPLLWWGRRYPRWQRYGVPALSLAVAVMGVWWLLDRTVLA